MFTDFSFLMEAHHFLCEAIRDFICSGHYFFRLQKVSYLNRINSFKKWLCWVMEIYFFNGLSCDTRPCSHSEATRCPINVQQLTAH